jgi:hypothetical protein
MTLVCDKLSDATSRRIPGWHVDTIFVDTIHYTKGPTVL